MQKNEKGIQNILIGLAISSFIFGINHLNGALFGNSNYLLVDEKVYFMYEYYYYIYLRLILQYPYSVLNIPTILNYLYVIFHLMPH